CRSGGGHTPRSRATDGLPHPAADNFLKRQSSQVVSGRLSWQEDAHCFFPARSRRRASFLIALRQSFQSARTCSFILGGDGRTELGRRGGDGRKVRWGGGWE